MGSDNQPIAEQARQLKRRRVQENTEALKRIWSDELPRPTTISAGDVDLIRDVIRKHLGHEHVVGVLKTIRPDAAAGQTFTSLGVPMGPAHIAMLFRLAGWPMVESDPHGTCLKCRFGPYDRNLEPPCVGCGPGRPCFMPKEEAIQPEESLV